MSATFVKEDKEWLNTSLKGGKFNEFEETLLFSAFDTQTEYDIVQIEKKIKKEKYLRKVCLYKILMHPFEYVLTRAIFDADKGKELRKLNSLYLSYYRNKISVEELEKKLQQYLNNDRIM
jgi:hypothetical protein